MSAVGKVFGIAGVVGGVVGAAALGGVTAQRIALRKYRAGILEGEEAYDDLPSDRSYSVVAHDGVLLNVEEVGPLDARLTVVFAHGWALRLGSWHYQRLGLSGMGFGSKTSSGKPVTRGHQLRMVFFDQRSHGRSTRPKTVHPTMTDLALDLAAVIATAAPVGPVVLIGHSMGGMGLLRLAGMDPDFISRRVAGVGLLCTSATERPNREIGRLFVQRGNPLLKAVSSFATRYSGLIERGRATTRDAVWLVTRVVGFARKDVPAPLVDYLDEMLTGTSIEVIADFVPGILAHDEVASLPALAGIPTLILAGDSDHITPPVQSQFMADALPEAEYVLVERAGHLAPMEAAEETNEALRRLLRRSMSYANRKLKARSA